MFERRLKIFLAILLVFVLVLLGRAMQLQIVERNYWRGQADLDNRKEKFYEPTRGRILDCKGQILAEDDPCMDACVDYRAIVDPPDKDWVQELALGRLKDRSDAYRKASLLERKQMLEDEEAAVTDQIHVMWAKLTKLSGKSEADIEELRNSLEDRIAMRRRTLWFEKYQALSNQASAQPPPWYRKWLLGEKTDAPQIDDVANVTISEELASHVILEAIDTPAQNELQKHLDEYPGLSLEPSTHRVYPYGKTACHVIGHMGKVRREDVAADPNLGDELRSYKPNDNIGRDGLEALGEPTLRGTRGKDVFDGSTGDLVSSDAPRAGDDLHTTIDIDLQAQIQDLFTHVKVPYGDNTLYDVVPMHGAAVVIDIASGDVKAMASYPDYNLNDFDKLYPIMAGDNLDAPLLNRATQAMLEPGSTVKPVVGAGAITQGLLGVHEGIECTGFLVINGKRYTGFGKCWTASIGKAAGVEFSHHPFPFNAPHRGHDGNADGFLTYSDALERSCNVFFETVANRLQIGGLTHWMKQFGLGCPTGIGIAEVRGRVPDSFVGANRQFATWTAGIGQGPVAATPLQMCNVAATIARRGIWLRPNLVQRGQHVSPYRPHTIADGDKSWDDVPDRRDLHLAPEAVDAAIEGMTRVVNGAAGTGTTAFRGDILVAGKTGTAQAAPFKVPKLDANNEIMRREDGAPIMEPLPPSTHDHQDKEHLWYRASDEKGEKLNHAWFIGFVPANNPQYAISVMVEYGGGGGGVISGPIASQIIDALVEHNYLQVGAKTHSRPDMD